MTKNTDKVTKAGAVELDESELDQVTGGYTENDSKGKKITASSVKSPTVKSPNDKGDGLIAFGAETST